MVDQRADLLPDMVVCQFVDTLTCVVASNNPGPGADPDGPAVSAAMVAHGRTLGEPRLSPDGEKVSFVSAEGARSALVVIDLVAGIEQVITTAPGPRSARPFGGGTYGWMPDGTALVFVDSGGGLWRVPATGGPTTSIRPGVRGRSIGSPVVSADGHWIAYTVDDCEVVVASLHDPTTLPVVISNGADFCFDPVWAPDGSAVLWHEWDMPNMPWDSSRIVAANPDPLDGRKAPYTIVGGDDISVGQPRFSSAGHLAYLYDRSGWANIWVRDPEARAVAADLHEHADPTWGPGQRSFAWSPDGRWIIHTRNENGHGALRLVEVSSGRTVRVAQGHHGGLDWAGRRVVAIRSGAATPTELVVMDLARWYEQGEALPLDGGRMVRVPRRRLAVGPVAGFEESGALVEPELVSWTAPDGLEIPARLYRTPRPEVTRRDDDQPSPAPPLIVWIHGGPTDQWRITFRPRLAYFLDRGWSVLVPDHRGSSGHGRAFTRALLGRWGEADTSDVAAGVRMAVKSGWGDPDRIVAMGGSSGGFTVLNLLARHPELCAAGVDLYGVADLADVAARTHRFEGHYFESIVGPTPSPDSRYRERSPMTVIHQIHAPLLVLHGSDDPVVPVDQSQSIVDRLIELGRPVELHVYPREGHGLSRPSTVIDELERIEDFLERHVLAAAPGGGARSGQTAEFDPTPQQSGNGVVAEPRNDPDVPDVQVSS